ncbi:MAG: tRNA (guanosine(46)-N7)-methyltransferase TrmB [Clostridiales bacterium]|nr:tRNA (guanosine(46)-N7)-methyltransferase TrmB [Clostridiales bacterium]MBS5877464.1 tRNA (guanosine(46)-N7)-methyltransferase TrmB [Clostridiales bacterium]
MRLRNIPGAREKMIESEYVFTEYMLKKEKWKSNVFKNENPLHIEIGSGKGRFITTLAGLNPDINYLGIEKYSSVLLKLLKKQEELDLPNLRLIRMDATDITDAFGQGEVDMIYLNFSDPWPKDRHAKRRLTSDRFLSAYEKILRPGGIVEFKTDNRDLFDFSAESVNDQPGWELLYLTHDLYADEDHMMKNVPTEYELKFTAAGNKINKLIARLTD